MALGQHQLIIKEIPNTLSFVVQQNNIRFDLWARRLFYTLLFFRTWPIDFTVYFSLLFNLPTPCLLLLETVLEVSRFTLKLCPGMRLFFVNEFL